MSSYVLVASYSDRSGIRSAWGPFATEADAKAAATELGDIGVEALMEIFPLRHLVPIAGTSDGLHTCAEKRGALIGSPADTERCGCLHPVKHWCPLDLPCSCVPDAEPDLGCYVHGLNGTEAWRRRL